MQQQVSMMAEEQRTELDTMDENPSPQRDDEDNGRDNNDGDSDGPDETMSQANWDYRQQRDPKLLPLSPNDDTEHFLTTFERMAQVCHWPKDGWAVCLVPLLTGKACSAYVLMDMKDSEKYKKVKAAILAKYEITPDTYHRQFHCLKIEPGEMPRELYVHLKDLFCKWVKPEKATVKELSETIILEQFLRMVHPELDQTARHRQQRKLHAWQGSLHQPGEEAELPTLAGRTTRPIQVGPLGVNRGLVSHGVEGLLFGVWEESGGSSSHVTAAVRAIARV